MTDRAARRVRVRGRVQGVGFRYFTLQIARSLGVTGWVRNLENGDVEAHAEGDSGAVDQFVSRLRQGPSFAFVSELDDRPVTTEGFESFSIRR